MFQVKDIIQNRKDDQILVKKILGGDSASFSVIIKNTEGLVAEILFKMIPVKEDRRDIAQDVYLKAYQNLKNFRFQSKISTWIAQIAYNSCLNYTEKKKLLLIPNNSDNKYTDDEILDSLNCSNGIQSNETENILFQKELSEILANELDKLSPLYKTLITLYHNEDLSYAEISEITGLPDGTVKSYLFRARRELRDNILLTYKNEAL
jgi:RNA polymerase sigma-70 factor (ECF subfamily)